jgi:division protein CdvB (Snf7/Vps24/ESCRT-III family)
MASIIINEKQLERLIGKVKTNINEGGNHDNNRYMFFSNLEQMKRQCEMLLDMDQNEIESILEHGHDWAQDHIAEAKNNMDQVFDFIMNEVNGEGDDSYEKEDDDEMIEEGKKKTGSKLCARGKAAAKSKFDVYPSAYANGYAVQVCKGKINGLDGKKQCSGSYC